MILYNYLIHQNNTLNNGEGENWPVEFNFIRRNGEREEQIFLNKNEIRSMEHFSFLGPVVHPGGRIHNSFKFRCQRWRPKLKT